MQRAVLVAAVVVLTGCPPPPAASEGFRTAAFPDGFRFGTAIAQWQVEGDRSVDGPVASNWSTWARLGRTKGAQQNPDGNGFFDAFPEEARRAKELGLQDFRLGLDWSRVEPQPGVYDDAEIDRFVDVLDALRDEGLRPVLTLWHWTVPTWVQDAEQGVDLIASPDRAVVDAFDAYVRRVLPRVKDRVDVYTVLNEPFSMISAGYLGGQFPPGRFLAIDAATDFALNLLYMHARAYDAIEELDDVDADGDGDPAFVGLTMSANGIRPETPGNVDEEFAADHLSYVYNDWLITALTTGDLDVNLDRDADDADTDPPEGRDPALAGRLDFVGVQYYGPVVVRAVDPFTDFHPLYGLPLLDVAEYGPDLPHNGMGREISAAGFRETLDIYAKHGVPMLVTENGTTTNLRPDEVGEDGALPELQFSDEQAAHYVVEHLWELGRAIDDGLDVRAYYHWTLSDNFEWVEGRLQRFGAYRVDFDDPTYPRTLNEMGEALRDVVGKRAVDEAIWNAYADGCYPTDRREGCGPTTSEPVVGPLK